MPVETVFIVDGLWRARLPKKYTDFFEGNHP